MTRRSPARTPTTPWQMPLAVGSAGVVAALVIQTGVGLMVYRSTARLVSDEKWTSHTHEVLSHMATLLADITDGETGARGFTITGNEAYLEPYWSATSEVEEELATVKRLTADNRRQQERVGELEPLVQARMAALKETIDVRRTAGLEAAVRLTASNKGKSLHDSIRVVVDAMETEENRLLTERRIASEAAARRINVVIVWGNALSLVLLGVAGWVVTSNMASRHRAESALEAQNRALMHATEQALAADRIKSAFLAIMSHELRTPLNSIIGFTGIVLQGLAGPLNPEQEKQLGMVRGSARHLLALINHVLDLSKIEAGQLELAREPFDPGASIRKVIAMVAPLAEAKGLGVSLQVDPGLGSAVGDGRRFEQVLLNLLSNAVKFTQRGGVTVTAQRVAGFTVGEVPIQRPGLSMGVTDSGIGIRPEDLDMLFQPFRQVDSRISRAHEGTGLGLAICRRLVGLMEGEISAQSTWEKGSTFRFTIPLEGPLHNEREDSPHRGQRAEPLSDHVSPGEAGT